jgi:hypothetical protein
VVGPARCTSEVTHRLERQLEWSGVPSSAGFFASVELPVEVDFAIARPNGGVGGRERGRAGDRVERACVEFGNAAAASYLDTFDAPVLPSMTTASMAKSVGVLRGSLAGSLSRLTMNPSENRG